MGYPSVTTLPVRGDRWPCTCTCKSTQIYIKLGISLRKLQVNMEAKCKMNKNYVCFIFPWKISTVEYYMHQCIKTVLRGTVARDRYFFEDQYFLWMSWWFSRSFESSSLRYTINYLFASLKLLIKFENDYRNPPQNSLLCSALSFIGGVHIGARALFVPNLIWFGFIARLSQWGGGGNFLVQTIFTCREEGRGGGGRHPVELTCHRRIPVWFYRITGGFLYAFPV
jgi:hypothetical protein